MHRLPGPEHGLHCTVAACHHHGNDCDWDSGLTPTESKDLGQTAALLTCCKENLMRACRYTNEEPKERWASYKHVHFGRFTATSEMGDYLPLQFMCPSDSLPPAWWGALLQH